MTPEAKAKEIFDKFLGLADDCGSPYPKTHAIAGAVLCVKEILLAKHSCGCEESIVIDGKYETYLTYWMAVKREIEAI